MVSGKGVEDRARELMFHVMTLCDPDEKVAAAEVALAEIDEILVSRRVPDRVKSAVEEFKRKIEDELVNTDKLRGKLEIKRVSELGKVW